MSHTAIDVSCASSSRVSVSPLCQGAVPVGRKVSGRSTSVQYLDPWMDVLARVHVHVHVHVHVT